MRRIMKWVGIGLGGLVVLLIVAAAGLYVVGAQRLTAPAGTAGEGFTIPASAAAVARGEYLVNAVAGCADCHGENLAGTEFLNDPAIGLMWAPNLTAGEGGVGATYSDGDWERSVRHGVRPNGEALLIMPSHLYSRMSDEDLGAVLAYIKTFPPVDQAVPPRQIAVVGHILLGAGMFGTMPVAQIDHKAGHTASVAPEVSAGYGRYLVSLGACAECHGAKLDGQGGGAPSEVPPADLTPSGNLTHWSEAEFITAMRTGVTPDGRTLSTEMPWKLYGNMRDEDLAAIYAYLKTLPASGQ